MRRNRLNTVRVFLSSPFLGFDDERDHLSTVVFPELCERLQQIDLRFLETDLRWGLPREGDEAWGLPEDDDPGRRLWRIWWACRKGIDRCMPFFIGMLSDHYGTILPAKDIEREPNPALRDCFKADAKRWPNRSITEMEIRYAAFNGQDHQQPGALFYFRSPELCDAANLATDLTSEAPLLHKLCRDIVKSKAPAKDVSGDSLNDLGRRILEDLWSDILRCPDVVPRETWELATGRKTDEIPEYTDRTGQIPEDMWRAVAEVLRSVPQNRFDQAAVATASFIAGKTFWFFGREQQLSDINQFIRQSSAGRSPFLIVTGPQGQGKTSLLCQLAKQAGLDEQLKLISCFAGATDQSDSIAWVLTQILHRLDGDESGKVIDRIGEIELLKHQVGIRLEDIPETERLVVVIDGLDLFADAGDLSWLPPRPGPGVRFVLSFASSAADTELADLGLPGDALLEAFRDIRPSPLVLTDQGLEQLSASNGWPGLPALEQADAGQLIESVCQDRGKYLSSALREKLVQLPQGGNPLYLTVLVSELCQLTGSGRELYRLIPELIDQIPRDYRTIQQLFGWCLDNVVTSLQAATPGQAGGEPAVAFWNAWLALSRDGMSGTELAQLLSRKLGREHTETAFRIERLLRPYLQFRGDRLDFFHQGLKYTAESRYLPKSADDRTRFHADIADLFDSAWQLPESNTHALSELPWHLSQCDRGERLGELLTDYTWLILKLESFGTSALIDDFDLARTTDDGYLLIRDVLRRSQFIIDARSDQLASQLLGRLPDSSLVACRLRASIDNNLDTCSLNPVTNSLSLDEGPLKGVFTLHPGRRLRNFADSEGNLRSTAHNVFGDLAVSDDGRLLVAAYRYATAVWNVDRSSLLRILPAGGQRLFLLDDNVHLLIGETLRISLWNINTGQLLSQIPLEGRGEVLALDADCAAGVIGAVTRSEIVVWSIEDQTRMLRHELVFEGITAAAISVRKNVVVAVCEDNRMHVGAPSDGKFSRSVVLHDCDLTHQQLQPSVVALFSDGRHAVTASEQRIFTDEDFESDKEWLTEDQLSQVPSAQRQLNQSYIAFVTMFSGHEAGDFLRLQNGHREEEVRRLIRERNALRIWDLETGEEVIGLRGHSRSVNAITTATDPLKIVSSGDDCRVNIFDAIANESNQLPVQENSVSAIAVTADGRYVATASDDMKVRLWRPEASTTDGRWHSGAVVCVTAMPDGQNAVSGGEDGIIRIWDLATGNLKHVLTGHTGAVNCVVPLSDTTLASGSADGTLRVWDTVDGVETQQINAHPSGVSKVIPIESGRCVLTCHTTGRAEIKELVSRGLSHSFESVAFPQDENERRNSDSSIRAWDVSTGELTGEFSNTDGAPHDLVVDEKKETVVSVHGRDLRVWDLQTQQLKFSLASPEDQPVAGVALVHSSQAICPCFTGNLIMFNLEPDSTPEIIGDFDFSGEMKLGACHKAVFTEGLFALSVNGRSLNTWCPLMRRQQRSMQAHADRITDFAVTESGQTAVTVSDDHNVVLWNWHRGGVLARFNAESELACCAISPDGSTVIAGAQDGRVHLLRLSGAWANARQLHERAGREPEQLVLDGLRQWPTTFNPVRHSYDKAWAAHAYIQACSEFAKNATVEHFADTLDLLLTAVDLCDTTAAGIAHIGQSDRHDALQSICSLVSKAVGNSQKQPGPEPFAEIATVTDAARQAIDAVLDCVLEDAETEYAGRTIQCIAGAEAALSRSFVRTQTMEAAVEYAARAVKHLSQALESRSLEDSFSVDLCHSEIGDTCAALADSGALLATSDRTRGIRQIAQAVSLLNSKWLKSRHWTFSSGIDAISRIVAPYIVDADVEGVRSVIRAFCAALPDVLPLGWSDRWLAKQASLYLELAERIRETERTEACEEIYSEIRELVGAIEDDELSDDTCGLVVDHFCELGDYAPARQLIDTMGLAKEKVRVSCDLIKSLAKFGHLEDASATFDRAVKISHCLEDESDNWRLNELCNAAAHVAGRAIHSNRPTEFRETIEKAEQVARRITDEEICDETLESFVQGCADVIQTVCSPDVKRETGNVVDDTNVESALRVVTSTAEQIQSMDCRRLAMESLDIARSQWVLATLRRGLPELAIERGRQAAVPYFRIRIVTLVFAETDEIGADDAIAELTQAVNWFDEIDDDGQRDDAVGLIVKALIKVAGGGDSAKSFRFGELLLTLARTVQSWLPSVVEPDLRVECVYDSARLLAVLYSSFRQSDETRESSTVRLQEIRKELRNLANQALQIDADLSDLVHDLVQERLADCYLDDGDLPSCLRTIRTGMRIASYRAWNLAQLSVRASKDDQELALKLAEESETILEFLDAKPSHSEPFSPHARATRAVSLSKLGFIESARSELVIAESEMGQLPESLPDGINQALNDEIDRATKAIKESVNK